MSIELSGVILTAGTPTMNGRIYDKETLLKITEQVKNKPVLSYINSWNEGDLSKVIGICSNFNFDGNSLSCDVKVQPTPCGKIVEESVTSGYKLSLHPIVDDNVEKDNAVIDYVLTSISVSHCYDTDNK